MLRLGRWKSGLGLLLLLHLLVHPATHVLRPPEIAASSASHVLVSQAKSDSDDVCSLCRVANALHAPVTASLPGQFLPAVGGQGTEKSLAPKGCRTLAAKSSCPSSFPPTVIKLKI